MDETIVLNLFCGSAFYFAKDALRISSDGCSLTGGAQVVIVNKPRVCRWASWMGVEAAIEYIIQEMHNVDSPFNMVVSWGATNALFSVHQGSRATVREGLKASAYGGVAWFAVSGLEAFLDSRYPLQN